MSEETNQQENLQQIYTFALELKQSGKTDAEIHATLLEKGMDEETSQNIINNMNNALAANEEDEGSSGMGWIVWILVLVGVNVLSYVFGWGFWIY